MSYFMDSDFLWLNNFLFTVDTYLLYHDSSNEYWNEFARFDYDLSRIVQVLQTGIAEAHRHQSYWNFSFDFLLLCAAPTNMLVYKFDLKFNFDRAIDEKNQKYRKPEVNKSWEVFFESPDCAAFHIWRRSCRKRTVPRSDTSHGI